MKAYDCPMTSVTGMGRDRYPDRFGVEIEWERVRYIEPTTYTYWNTTHDGSLRNNGAEWVSIPLARNDAPYAFEELMEKRGTTFTSVATERCGVHVHVNVLSLTYGEWLAMMIAYAAVEPAMMAACGDDRNDNVFCVPWYHTPRQVEAIGRVHQDLMNSPHIAPRMRHNTGGSYNLPQFNKYQALNLLPLWTQGTVEFRMAPTWEIPEIQAWAETCVKLREFAKGSSPDEMSEIVLGDGVQTIAEAIGLPMLGGTGYEDEALDLAMTLAGERPVPWERLEWVVPEEPVHVGQIEMPRTRRIDAWGNEPGGGMRIRVPMPEFLREHDEYPEDEDEEYYEEEDV